MEKILIGLIDYGVLGILGLLFLVQYREDIKERKAERERWEKERDKREEKEDSLIKQIADLANSSREIIEVNSNFIKDSAIRHDELDVVTLESKELIEESLAKIDDTKGIVGDNNAKIAQLEQQIKEQWTALKNQENLSKREAHYAKEQFKVSLATYKHLTGESFPIKEYTSDINIEI